jgi:hypothetical protein
MNVGKLRKKPTDEHGLSGNLSGRRGHAARRRRSRDG